MRELFVRRHVSSRLHQSFELTKGSLGNVGVITAGLVIWL